MKKVNEFLTYAAMLDSVACVQFVLMLIELNKVLIQELKCWRSKTTTVLSEWTVSKTVAVSVIFLLH